MSRGFTLVEVLVVVGIVVLITGALTSFERTIFTQNSLLQNNLLADQDARTALRSFVAELREAAPSDAGAYAIASAASTSITFYADVKGDGLHDRIRYFVATSTLWRGFLKPTGSPLVYNNANETVTTLARGLTSSSPTIFSYYNDNYAGTSTPLAFPVDVAAVRLVQLTLSIDNDPNQPPGPSIYTTEVSVRSLKDNL